MLKKRRYVITYYHIINTLYVSFMLLISVFRIVTFSKRRGWQSSAILTKNLFCTKPRYDFNEPVNKHYHTNNESPYIAFKTLIFHITYRPKIYLEQQRSQEEGLRNAFPITRISGAVKFRHNMKFSANFAKTLKNFRFDEHFFHFSSRQRTLGIFCGKFLATPQILDTCPECQYCQLFQSCQRC